VTLYDNYSCNAMSDVENYLLCKIKTNCIILTHYKNVQNIIQYRDFNA